MPFIQTPGLNIHYELAGAGQTVLVLVHGNFASWRWWRPVLERLPAGYQAYAPDLRGCGDTDHPPTGYNIEQLARDLYAFVTALDLPAFHLVGHSLGGAVAMQFALDHPEQIQSLLLVAPAPAEGISFFQSHNTNLPRLWRLFDVQDEASLDLLESNYRLLRTLEANRPLLRRALRRMMPSLTPNQSSFKALVDDAARMAPEAVVGFLQSLDAWNVQPDLATLEMPVFILWGKKDILIPLPALQQMSRDLKQARLVIWKSVGHSPQLELPGRFVRLLIRFTSRGLATESDGPRWWNALSRRLGHWLKQP